MKSKNMTETCNAMAVDQKAKVRTGVVKNSENVRKTVANPEVNAESASEAACEQWT